MKVRFREKSPVVIALVTLAGLAALLFGSFQLAEIPLFAGSTYHARFAEGGGLKSGDKVRMSGSEIGKVTDVDLEDGDVVVTFTAKGVRLGDLTSSAIKTQTLLGERYLNVESRGAESMSAGDTIPVERTTSPYSLTEGIEDLSRTTGEVDMAQVGNALDSISDAFRGTPEEIGPAFEGVARLSETLASRDQALRDLFARAEQVTGVLKDHTGELQNLITDGNALLDELQARRAIIRELLVRTTAATDQLSGFVDEQHDRLAPTLTELNQVLAILQRNNGNISSAIERVAGFITGLGEGLASGPWFNGHADLAGIPLTVLPVNDFVPGLALPDPGHTFNGETLGGLPGVGDLVGLGGNDR
ncbi:MCE family protein [Pseudonocardia sp. RS010]|uniref:MCE family protein n=1 Tax=Pseudonocardia sp. RS010 TaxID=3385979 RepID=UPI0039A1AE97